MTKEEPYGGLAYELGRIQGYWIFFKENKIKPKKSHIEEIYNIAQRIFEKECQVKICQ